MLCHWIPYFLCLFSHLAPLESIKSGNFATSIFQYYRYRDQSVTWNYYLQNGANHDEFLLKFAFFGQEEKRMCTCVRAKVVQQCARTLWFMWCLPGTHPRGLTPPAPTLEHPQIPNQPSKAGRHAWAEGTEGAAVRVWLPSPLELHAVLCDLKDFTIPMLLFCSCNTGIITLPPLSLLPTLLLAHC